MAGLAARRNKRTPSVSPGADSYHHGDLRTALIEASAGLIAERGPHGFSLREVARRAGVSNAAPYRHFESRDDLVAAVAREGFDVLHAVLERHGDRERDPLARLRARLRAYAGFAVAYPAWHRVMFSQELGSDAHSVRDAAHRPVSLFTRDVIDCQRAGRIQAGESRDKALVLWSMAQGVASLAAQEHIDEAEAAAIIDASIESLRTR